MTGPEFQKWFDHFAAAFPAVKDFVRKGDKPGTLPDRAGEATLTLWLEVLKTCDLGDCLQVTNEVFGLQTPPWVDRGGYHDWSAVPRHVRRLCAELHPVEPEWKQHTVRRHVKGIIESDASMAAAYRESIRILDDGGTMDDVRAYLDGVYGTSSRVSNRPNYEPSFENY
jgi:hypothetical protein